MCVHARDCFTRVYRDYRHSSLARAQVGNVYTFANARTRSYCFIFSFSIGYVVIHTTLLFLSLCSILVVFCVIECLCVTY